MVVGLVRLKCMRQAGDPGKSLCLRSQPKAVRGRVFSSGETCVFFFKAFTDWMRPTHEMEGHLLHSKSTDLNTNHI